MCNHHVGEKKEQVTHYNELFAKNKNKILLFFIFSHGQLYLNSKSEIK